MPDKITPAIDIFTTAWVAGLASFGGIAGYIRKIRHGMSKKFSVAELVGEVIISSFVGIITYFLCSSQNIDQTLSAALIGISGHMGSRAIYLMEYFVKEKIGIETPPCENHAVCPFVDKHETK